MCVVRSARVVNHVRKILSLDGNKVFGSGLEKNIDIKTETNGESPYVAVYAIRELTKPNTGKDVLSQIKFWVHEQGLDKFVQVYLLFFSSVCKLRTRFLRNPRICVKNLIPVTIRF